MPDNLTLLDTAVLEQKPLRKAIYFAMFKGRLPSPVEFIPVAPAKSFTQQSLRLTAADTPTTRNIGGSAGAYKAKFSDRHETIKIIQDKITLDVEQLEVKTYVQDPIALQIRVYGDTLRALQNDLLVNGDPGADETEPEGLHVRLRDDATFIGQSVDANALDVDNADAERYTWLDKIDEAITLCGGGDPDICIVNRQTWLKFRSALRHLKLFDTTKDQFDRMIMQYGRVKILNAGNKPANLLSPTAAGQVIGDDTQTSIFGDATTTPMYFLQTQGEEGVKLLQVHPLRVKRLGVNTNAPAEYVISLIATLGILIPQRFAVSSVQGLDIT